MTYEPVLSLTTATFEIMAAIWALRGPGRRTIIKPAATLLVLLAVFLARLLYLERRSLPAEEGLPVEE